jgi:small-conductance mechanosensitive channel
MKSARHASRSAGVRSGRMSLAHPSILAASFWHRHEHLLVAVLTVVIALLVATVVDRLFARRGRTLARVVSGGRLTPVVDTRLLFLRRLVYATIVVLGLALALAQFTALDKLAAGVLASGAIVAAIVGFAARQTLANAVAGVMLAVAQPFRVGDHIVFEGESGTVDDIRLTYTYLRATGDTRVVIPNERLASGILRNETILDPTSPPAISVWLGREADAPRAVAVLGERLGVEAALADITAEGVRIDVIGTAPPAGDQDLERADREARLRLDCLRALRDAGVSG